MNQDLSDKSKNSEGIKQKNPLNISNDQKNIIFSQSTSIYISKASINNSNYLKGSKKHIKSQNPLQLLPVNSTDWKKNTISELKKKPSNAVPIVVPHNSPPSWVKTRNKLDISKDAYFKENSKNSSSKLQTSNYIDYTKIQNSIKKLLEGTFLDDHAIKDKEATPYVDGLVPGLKVRLLEHQINGLQWLQKRENQDSQSEKGGILADDMGLGKTIQAIALIASRKRPKCFQNIYSKGTLIVAPLSIIRQWESEIITKSDLSVLVYHGIERTKHFKNFESYDVVITTYHILVSEIKDISDIKKLPGNQFNHTTGVFTVSWWRLILDEAQAIKNKNSKTTIAACSLKGCNRWCLTGTPIQNSIEELYSLFKFLRIEPLNDFTVWREQISKVISQGNDEISFKRLKVILNTVMLRRTKVILQKNIDQDKTLLCLPEKTIKYEMIKLDTHEREFYNKLESYAYKNLSKFIKNGIEGKNYTNILCLLLRLRQACNHSELALKKLTLDKDTIDISGNAESLSSVNDYVNDIISLFDDGSMPHYLRENSLRELRECEDTKVLLCSLKSGALGLNLTIASRVILLDIWWNPAVEDQAIDRVYRIGQTKNVIIHKIIAKNTIEQKILMLQEKKKVLIKETLSDEKSALIDLNKLTFKDILFLFNHKS
ncbi:hypothetical protein PCANB_002767 [Pneumocystis canis]|nr:hypothetical protein PCANB_002767 [Pneumocystis canis]